MGFYFSEDHLFVTSTLSTPPTTFLTEKGQQYKKAAIIIQRWFRKLKYKN